VIHVDAAASGAAGAAGGQARADGRIACAIDGRVRTDALARSLGLDPALAPARLVAEGHRLLGAGVAERLGGEFALAVWDRERGTGLLARDRLGARPLFLAERGGALLFASEVRNLLALLPARPAPDGLALAHWLDRSPAPDGRTLFAGIRALPGGGAVVLEDGRWREARSFRPRPRTPVPLATGEAAAAIRRALGAGVERALAGAERPGLMLSGGLDSAAVAAAAVASPGAARPVAYSGVFPAHPAVDESDRIARVRERLGLDGVAMALGCGSALDAADEFQRAWELPPVTPNRFVWRPLLERAAADGVDVLLDGEGGDELFGCARYLVADELRRARPLAAVRTARRLPGMGGRPRPRWIGRALLAYGLRGALPHGLHERLRAARGRRDRPDWLAPDIDGGRWAWKELPGPRWWAQLASALWGDRVGAADQARRQAAMHGLAARHPLRDPDLIELVLGLPPELGFDPRLDRPLLRRALAGELPAEALRDTRKPFFNALAQDALGGPDLPRLRELLREPHPELAARLRAGEVGAMLARAGPGGAPPGWEIDLWRVATLELWLTRQADPDAGPARIRS
jgi:asparagine synthase (glutamine-hydrolysing)